MLEIKKGYNSSGRVPSNRSFGKMLSLMSVLAGIYVLYLGATNYIVIVFFILAVIFALLTIFSPNSFQQSKLAWLKLGRLMSKLFDPLTLGCVYFFMFTPVGLATRIFGRDILKLNTQNQRSSWECPNESYRDVDFTKQY